MPSQSQYDVTLQNVRQIDCKIAVLDKKYDLLDEISGLSIDVSCTVDAESDVRRTANITMTLKDDASINPRTYSYWTAGNNYWFDKYVQIYTAILDVKTGEYVWTNNGIYCVNTPSISYDATTNTLSFQAVDLMSKLTGMRNGQLEGMMYTIAAGSKIKNAIESLLIQQGFTQYILYDPPQATTPADINIDISSTAYDMLCQLRDINANWEIFFDVDGVFHFQQIPSGKVIIDPNTGETGEPTPLVNNNMWDKLMLSYTYDTSFEDVKNYVEVLGKMHEPDEMCKAEVQNGGLTLYTNRKLDSYYNGSFEFGFSIETGGGGMPTILAQPITGIVFEDAENVIFFGIDIHNKPITVGNMSYVVSLTFGANSSYIEGEYLGGLQPHAIAIENNPESPFYVGKSTEYMCATQKYVDFVPENTIVDASVPTAYMSGNQIYVNLSPWLLQNDFNSAPVNTEWNFRMWTNIERNTSATRCTVNIGSITNTSLLYNLAGELISLDFTQFYYLKIKKTGIGTFSIYIAYYPFNASNLSMSTNNVVTFPKFDNQVRLVCSGDEYDNIYTDELAEQRARYEVYLNARCHDTVTITSVPIYWLDVHNIIEFNPPNASDEERNMWLIKSIDTTIGTEGTQTITAIRYYPLYADISLENLATQE
jgi:hypothetical protein